MTKVPQALLLGSTAWLALSGTAFAAPSAPHPRIWLNDATRSALKAQGADANGPIARARSRCSAARERPEEYAVGGWQGFEFVTTLSACLTAYVSQGGADDLATAIKYWQVLLDDYQKVGDGLGGDSVVTHDTGYAMRTFAPFSALAYDWLHDAPGVTEELRAHSRARFHAWSTYYSTTGYLRDLPGANYHAGYAFAATLMAIAEAGEAGSNGDAHWLNVRDVIWQKGLLPAFSGGRVLDGGDWPEGWQYGSLSVLELSLAARAMQDNQDGGIDLAQAASWASALPLRFAYGLTPATAQAFTGGDSDATTPYRAPDNGPLLAALVGPATVEAKALARELNGKLGLKNENPLFDALAAAAASTVPAAPLSASAATNYLAHGTGNWYVRGAWTPDTAWSVFQCSRRLVDDHQYSNAGNWVLTRGGDDVVVDPSPYGSLSTLTGNAPAVDSKSLPAGYSPSQGYWGESTKLLWSRQSGSGVAAARCDYADQFRRSDVPSDVSHALRDFVLIPQASGAAVVLVDRVVTGAAERALHLRVRTPAALSLDGDTASGKVGGSALAIRKLWASSGVPNVRVMPKASECPSSDHACDVSKLDTGSEYRIDVAGPSAFAIHVVSARADATAQSELLSGSGYRGTLVTQGSARVAVVASDSVSPAATDPLRYRAPSAGGVVHVVLDAPVDGDGKSDFSATRDGADCQVEVRAHSGSGQAVSGRPLMVRLSTDCAMADDGEALPPTLGTDSGVAPAGSAGSPRVASSAVGGAGGMGTSLPEAPGATAAGCAIAPGKTSRRQRFGFVGLGLLGLVRLARQRKRVQLKRR